MQASESPKIIAASAQKCVQSFRTCLACPTIRNDALDEQYARISIWIENMGVFAPPHLSLDHRLRNVYSIRSITNELLELLQDTLDYLSLLATTNFRNSRDEPMSVSSTQTIDEADELEICTTRNEIDELLSRLMRLAWSIRRSTATNRDLKVKKFYQRMLDRPDGDLEDLEDYMSYAKWQINRNLPKANANIIIRVLNAIRTRNQILLYQNRQQYRLRLTEQITAESAPAEHMRPGLATEAVTKCEGLTATSVSAPDQTVFRALFASSRTTPSFVGTRSLQQNSKLDFPRAPKQTGVTEFECPYCRCVLHADVGKDHAWRSHVLKDLRPYMCVYEQCKEDPDLFESPQLWLHHMQNEHGTHYICSSDAHDEQVLYNKHAFESHIRSEHGQTVAEDELPILIANSARSAIPIIKECPFCDESPHGLIEDSGRGIFMSSSLQTHIVEHLKALCLYVMQSDDLYEGEVSRTSSGTLESMLRQNISRRGSTTFSVWSDGDRSQDEANASRSGSLAPNAALPTADETTKKAQIEDQAEILIKALTEHEAKKQAAAEEKARIEAETVATEENAKKGVEVPFAEEAKTNSEDTESKMIATMLENWEKERQKREDEEKTLNAGAKEKAEERAAEEAEIAAFMLAAKKAAVVEGAAKAANAEATPKAVATAKDTEARSELLLHDDQKCIHFYDAMGRRYDLPWKFAKTFRGMEGMIKQAHSHIAVVSRNIDARRYDLIGPDDNIILHQVWEMFVQPGWEVRIEIWPDPPEVPDKEAAITMPPLERISEPKKSKKPVAITSDDDSIAEAINNDAPKRSSKKKPQSAFSAWMLGTRPAPSRKPAGKRQ